MYHLNFIPFEHTDAMLRNEFKEALESVLDNKRYILGPHVKTFERSWANYCGTKYSIGTGSGFDAISLCLLALELNNRDEVIVPAHTFAASILPVIHCGAKPILVDADPHTFNIDTQKIEDNISTNTKAILAVHLYGNPCNMGKLTAICNKYNLTLIEDNAQAHGAYIDNQRTGSIGLLSATSFYPVKNLGALGDAGAINTNNQTLFEKLMLLRNYGSPDKHTFNYAGINSRLDELQAAFLNIKLKYLEEWTHERQQIANLYSEALSKIDGLQLLTPTENSKPVYHIFPVLTPHRNALKNYLYENGVQTLTHYPQPYHLEKAFEHLNYKMGDFPVTEQICDQELSLPVFPGLTTDDVSYVCGLIKKFFSNNAGR